MESNFGKEEKRSLVKQFNELQAERVQTYNMFDEGHKAYLAGAPNYNFPMFRQLVHEITETFKKISNEIILIQQQFSANPDVSCIMKKVQEAEEKKLKLTAKLQVARQNVIDRPEEADVLEEEVKTLQQELRESIQDINEILEELKYASEDFIDT